MFTRRSFLLSLGALTVSPALSKSDNPFALGVASGYPLASGVTLWTRIMGAASAIPVRWEIASDETMKSVILSGTTSAEPEWAHSVHVDVQGLEPERWYWYRFTAGDAQSAIGRTRTAPPAHAADPPLRFAFGSCQQYEQGYFNAYRHIVADDPDLVVFLGDYIYESNWGRDLVRSHGAPEPYTLDEYRARYTLYHTDPDLQAAHAACPWIVTWDDHEVDNDYADDHSEDGMDREAFLRRRTGAYRAYYENMPLPARMRPEAGPSGPRMRIYTHLDWGTLARFSVLDCRQYRSWQACPRPGRRGGSNTIDIDKCPKLGSPGRSMLGRAQERWLERTLADSRAAWNMVVQTTTMAQFDQLAGPGRRAWTDGWDGYPAARQRFLRTLVEKRTTNPVVLGGDVHSFNVTQLKLDFDDPASPVVASEFVGTSVTSQAWPQERLNEFLPDNPHLLYADSRFRGYTRVNLSRGRCDVDLRALDSVQSREAACSTLASYVVESGRPGPLRA